MKTSSEFYDAYYWMYGSYENWPSCNVITIDNYYEYGMTYEEFSTRDKYTPFNTKLPEFNPKDVLLNASTDLWMEVTGNIEQEYGIYMSGWNSVGYGDEPISKGGKRHWYPVSREEVFVPAHDEVETHKVCTECGYEWHYEPIVQPRVENYKNYSFEITELPKTQFELGEEFAIYGGKVHFTAEEQYQDDLLYTFNTYKSCSIDEDYQLKWLTIDSSEYDPFTEGVYTIYVSIDYNSLCYENQTFTTSFEVTVGNPEVKTDFITGDVNHDGNFSIADIITFQKWLLNVPDIHLANWKAADLTNDNRLNVFDLCLMKRALLEK